MAEIKKIHQIRPNKGTDDVDFGVSVDQLQAFGYAERVECYNEITEWRTFTRDESLRCYVKDDVVIAIACFANCYVGGMDVIGVDENALLAMLGPPTEIGDALWVSDDQQQIPFEYEGAGFQIWLESGKVVSVFCDQAG